MKFLGQMWTGVHIPLSARHDIPLLLVLYLFNTLLFSAYVKLVTEVAQSPWLALAWLYGLVVLAPLAWRDKKPVLIFVIQCMLTVAAWRWMHWYAPIVGILIALYAVSVNCDRQTSWLAWLASLVPTTLTAIAISQGHPSTSSQIGAFLSNITAFVVMAFGAWIAGRRTQAIRQQAQALERQQVAVQEAVGAEKARIAEELKTILAETTDKAVNFKLKRQIRLLEASHLPSHTEMLMASDRNPTERT